MTGWSDERIAQEWGITRRTLVRWKEEPSFAARVKAISDAYADRALKHWLARKEHRISVLTDLHDRMLRVIQERAEDAELAEVPGGKTGIVTKTLKGIGKGEDFRVVEVYEVDTGTLKEIRAVQQQIAEELGQRIERSATLNLNRLFERMSNSELERYARDGVLPEWFSSAAGPLAGGERDGR